MIAALKWGLWALAAGLTAVLRLGVLVMALLSIVTLWALTWLLARMASFSRANAQSESSKASSSASRRATDHADQHSSGSGAWWL